MRAMERLEYKKTKRDVESHRPRQIGQNRWRIQRSV